MKMTDLNRRHFLQQAGVYLAATSTFCMGCNTSHARSYARGCSLNAASADALSRENHFFDQLNDESLNKLFSASVVVMTIYTELEPSFAFMEESEGRNAYATPIDIVNRSINRASPHGSVLFGINLLNELRNWPVYNTSPFAPIEAVIAHEWAHIAQFAHKVESYQAWRMELMADFVAGWSLAHNEAGMDELWRKKREYERANQDDAAGAMTFITSIGDTNFHSDSHHGTPRERLKAYIEGVKFQRGRASTKYFDALQEGFNRYI